MSPWWAFASQCLPPDLISDPVMVSQLCLLIQRAQFRLNINTCHDIHGENVFEPLRYPVVHYVEQLGENASYHHLSFRIQSASRRVQISPWSSTVEYENSNAFLRIATSEHRTVYYAWLCYGEVSIMFFYVRKSLRIVLINTSFGFLIIE